MADEEDEDAEPAVELGEGQPVEGAPLARVASRLTWPQERSFVERKEGDAVVRTPDGPRELSEILAETGETYFESRQHFVAEIQAVVGVAPVPTADE
ncbi:MAG: DUF5789 family protein [Haloferacaceae archaeon]